MTDDVVMPLRSDKRTLSMQAQDYLRDLIKSGTYQPGEQLPSESSLAAQLGISRPTLREALMNLEGEGILVRRHGVGTFVTSTHTHRLDSGLERLESLLELAKSHGLQVQIDSLQVSEEAVAADMATRLQIEPGSLVTTIQRSISVRETRIAYMEDVTPSAILPASAITDGFGGSVLDLLREKSELQLDQAIANIIARSADEFLTDRLDVKIGQAILLMEETLFNNLGKPVGYSCNYFVPDHFRFRVIRR